MLKRMLLLTLLMPLFFISCQSSSDQQNSDEAIHNPLTQEIPEDAKNLIGRWDLTYDVNGEDAPSWLDIQLSGFKTLVGRYVSFGGSARPVSEVILKDGIFHFSIPPQWEEGDGYFTVEGRIDGEILKGTLTTNGNEIYNFTGVKAPYLNRPGEVQWGEEINLINDNNLDGWHFTPGPENWSVENGILSSKGAGANIVSDKKFNDFKLSVEFRYPAGSNSGIYLRGRYEVQIEDSSPDQHPDSHLFGGVYGFLSPNEMVALGPDVWQKAEITLIGRLVTITINGKTVITRAEIPGITGGALDSHEGEPGPIYLQGDHGAVQFRNIKVIAAR